MFSSRFSSSASVTWCWKVGSNAADFLALVHWRAALGGRREQERILTSRLRSKTRWKKIQRTRLGKNSIGKKQTLKRRYCYQTVLLFASVPKAALAGTANFWIEGPSPRQGGTHCRFRLFCSEKIRIGRCLIPSSGSAIEPVCPATYTFYYRFVFVSNPNIISSSALKRHERNVTWTLRLCLFVWTKVTEASDQVNHLSMRMLHFSTHLILLVNCLQTSNIMQVSYQGVASHLAYYWVRGRVHQQ